MSLLKNPAHRGDPTGNEPIVDASTLTSFKVWPPLLSGSWDCDVAAWPVIAAPLDSLASKDPTPLYISVSITITTQK